MKYFGLPIAGIAILSLFLLIMISFVTINSLTPLGQVTNTRVNIYNALPSNCTFTIPAGTNQISLYCIPNGITINEVFENISFQTLRTYDATRTDKWKIYRPGMPSWVVQDLSLLERTKGYFIETNTAQQFLYEGSKRVPNSITIVPGWNFVGYSTDETVDIDVAFSTISGNYNEIRSYNNTDGLYYVFIPPATGDLTKAEPYRAYWVYATTTDSWVVN